MTHKDYSNNSSNAQAKSYPSMAVTQRIHFDCIDSTNSWAKKHPNRWALQGITLITASEQTAGRGRFKRQWISPPHLNIYASFCFWLDPSRTDVGHIPQLLALAALQAVEQQKLFPQIKWPNDLLLNGKKLGGILCETILEQGKRGIICGIGLNVNMPTELLSLIDRPAASLLVEAGHAFEVNTILEALQSLFCQALSLFLSQGFAPFFALFQQYSALKKGQNVRFHDNQFPLSAQFETLNPDGSVELVLMDGSKRTFYAGEFIDDI